MRGAGSRAGASLLQPASWCGGRERLGDGCAGAELCPHAGDRQGAEIILGLVDGKQAVLLATGSAWCKQDISTRVAIRVHKLNTSEMFSNCLETALQFRHNHCRGESICRMTFSAFHIRPSTDETGARHQGRCLLLNERQTMLL